MRAPQRIWLWQTVLFLGIIVILLRRDSVAHEGHAALPSKGVLVDAKNQRVSLATNSRIALGIETDEVSFGAIPTSMICSASIELPWNQHAFVSSPLAGRIVNLPVPSGASILKGQLLGELECPELERLQSDLRSAALELQVARQLVASTKQAAISGAIPGTRLLEAQTRVQQANATIKVLSAKWKSFDLPPESLATVIENPENDHHITLPIRSTIDGYVTHIDLAAGKYVTQNEHLFEIIDIEKVWLKIRVLESNLSKIKREQRVSFWPTALTSTRYESSIDCIDSFLDPVTHEGIAWSTLSNSASSNPYRLKPGMSVVSEVQIAPQHESLTVPVKAILRDSSDAFVMVEEERSKSLASYRRIPVVLGNTNGTHYSVTTDAMVPGDRVVIQGGYNLHYLLPHSNHTQGLAALPKTSHQDEFLKEQHEYPSAKNKLVFTGTFEVPPDHQATISSLLDGTIEKILVDRSQQVQRGDIVAELRSPEFQDLQLDFLQTHLKIEQAQITLDNLVSGGVAVPARQRLEAEGLLKQLISTSNALRNRLLQVGVPASDIQRILDNGDIIPTLAIRSPIAGTVIGFDQFLGKNIRSDQQLFSVQNLNYGLIQGFVPENAISLIVPGQQVSVHFSSLPDKTFDGVIARTNEAILPEDRTQIVWIELSDAVPSIARQGMLTTIQVNSTQTAPPPSQ